MSVIEASAANAKCGMALRLLAEHPWISSFFSNKPYHAYAVSLLKGEIPACALTRLAAARWIIDLAGMPENRLTFRPNAAERILKFAPRFRHTKGRFARRAFELEPWEAFCLANVFGWWMRQEDGSVRRRFDRFWLEVPRKNGKTQLAALIGLYLTSEDNESEAEVYSAATNKDQAELVWKAAISMVKTDDTLSSRYRFYYDRMIDTDNDSLFRPLAAKHERLDGYNPHGVLLDEVHAHPDRGVHDVLETGMGMRDDPLLMMTTTAGIDTHSFAYTEHTYAINVLMGVVDNPRLFAYVTGVDKGDEWTDPAVWRKANPNYGVTVTEQKMRSLVNVARDQPTARASLQRLRLNIWVGAQGQWLDMERWDKCDGPASLYELAGSECDLGMDLSSQLDLTAVVAGFELDGVVYLVPYFFLPADTLRVHVREDRVPYDIWRDEGLLIATPGAVMDYDCVRKTIGEINAACPVRTIRYDPYNATQIVHELENEGYECIQHRQGLLSMNEPSKELERLLAAERIRHGANALLRWNATNAVVASDPAGNIKPEKRKSTGRIDGIVASIMAITGIMEYRTGGSVYDPRNHEPDEQLV